MTISIQVARIVRETARIKSFELVSADGGALPPFTAGAHIDLSLGNGETRSYSLLNDPAETHRYVIGVLREHQGSGGSAWMHDVLAEGMTLTASSPSNSFELDKSGDHHILIGGGIGITPILSMAHRLKTIGQDYVIHYCARTRDDAAFVDPLITTHGERIRLHYDDGDPARGLDVASLLQSPVAGSHVYVCGPAGLIRATRDAASAWPDTAVHFELFQGSVASLSSGVSDAAFDIVLRKSGRTLVVPATTSLLDVLRTAGVNIKSVCRTGTCGTCYVGVMSGDVDHRDSCLDDDDRADGMQVCVSRAMAGSTLVLDL